LCPLGASRTCVRPDKVTHTHKLTGEEC
jgi:hypothetical protein